MSVDSKVKTKLLNHDHGRESFVLNRVFSGRREGGRVSTRGIRNNRVKF